MSHIYTCKMVLALTPQSCGFIGPCLNQPAKFIFVVVAHQAGAYPGFCSMKQLEVFLLSSGWDASPLQGYPQLKSTSIHLYTWVERGTVRVKCLAQEHNRMSQAEARTWTT